MVITIYRPWEKHYSSVGWRVRLALEEKGIKPETRLVVLKMNEHNSEELLRLNPRGELPILTDNEAVLHEESAMLQYIEMFYTSQPKLLPDPEKDKKAYTDALVLSHEALGTFAFICRPILVHLLNSTEGDKGNTTTTSVSLDKESVKKWKIDLGQELQRWEKLLGINQPYLMGKDVTMADVAFFPYLAHLVRFGFSLKKNFTKLQKYYQVMCERSTVQKTWPSGWKLNETFTFLA